MARVTRKIKFNYYSLCYREAQAMPSDMDSDFDLEVLINEIDGRSLATLTTDYYQEKARLDRYWYNERRKYWFLNFTRLRDTNIPSKACTNSSSEAITLEDNEYISEECNAIYDCGLKVLMLQRNIHSLSVSGIADYLNQILGRNDIVLYLRPIMGRGMLDRVRDAKTYRKINIRFADMRNQNFEAPEHSTLKKIYESARSFNGASAEIIISMSKDDRTNSLSAETVYETLEDIERNPRIITKAVASIKETDDTRVEVVDLFDELMHDYVTVVLESRMSLASEYVENEMLDVFNRRKGEIYEMVAREG